MTLLILGIILFLATHLIRVVAPGFRLSMIEHFDCRGRRYRGLGCHHHVAAQIVDRCCTTRHVTA
jgi:uncharacterized membrane protein